jgi:predicted ATP-grasp superfamily ATP-dependent carboligase
MIRQSALRANALGSELVASQAPGARPAQRILVTDGDERSALAIVRSLGRKNEFEVFVCSRNGHSLAGASRYAREDRRVGDALVDPAAFAKRLALVSSKLRADVLIPVSEASLMAVLSYRELFGQVLLPFPAEGLFRQVCDKAAVLEAARGLGIATPVQHQALDEHALRRLLHSGELGFPLVIKPARSVIDATSGRAKIGVAHASNADELAARASRYDAAAYPLLLQQRVVGPGVGVFLLRWNGRILAAFSHRRLREKPPSGGVSVYSESIALEPELLRQAEALLEAFSWQGVAMVEFKIDAVTGIPYLMEINGRFWGSLQLAIAAGVDFPLLLLRAAQNDLPIPVREYRLGLRNRWWWGDVDHLITRFRRSDAELALPHGSPTRLAALLQFFHWREDTQNEVLRLDDPAPFARETLNWLRGR